MPEQLPPPLSPARPLLPLLHQGVEGKFEGVLAVRQGHSFAFGKSDLFFVCAVRAAPGQVQLQPQVGRRGGALLATGTAAGYRHSCCLWRVSLPPCS